MTEGRNVSEFHTCMQMRKYTPANVLYIYCLEHALALHASYEDDTDDNGDADDGDEDLFL